MLPTVFYFQFCNEYNPAIHDLVNLQVDCPRSLRSFYLHFSLKKKSLLTDV